MTPDAGNEVTVGSLRFVASGVVPRRAEFNSTTLGGFSGIDYDRAQDRYFLISDDRTTNDSDDAPRAYTARITHDGGTGLSIEMLSTFPLKQPGGANYPKVPETSTADPEAVRLDPVSGNLAFASEGERFNPNDGGPLRLIQPFIREITTAGTHVQEYTLPSTFTITAAENGPRGNLVFEGIAFLPNGNLAALMEGPRYEDGPAASVAGGAVNRMVVLDRTSRSQLAQYAYPLEKLQVAPVPPTAFGVSGATDILALSNTRFLVLERSFSVGVVGNQIRLYEINLAAATDVSSIAALDGGQTAVTKRLVLDFETVKSSLPAGTNVANLEGITFGPKFANGRASLLVVGDDNFPTTDSVTDSNQFWLFEVVP